MTRAFFFSFRRPRIWAWTRKLVGCRGGLGFLHNSVCDTAVLVLGNTWMLRCFDAARGWFCEIVRGCLVSGIDLLIR